MINSGAQIIAIQPVWVQGLVGHAGRDASAAGYVLSAEMAGLAVATVLIALFGRRLPWRTTLVTALTVAILGNLTSVALVDATQVLSVVRFVTGLGAGTCVTLGFTALGRTARPDRNFGLCVATTLLYATVVFKLAPWLLGQAGLAALCLVFASVGVAVLPLVRYLPASAAEESKTAQPVAKHAGLRPWLGVAAFLTYFTAQGAFWTYAALVGTWHGISERAVASHLAAAQVAGLAGALVPVVLGARLGRRWPTVVGLALGLVPALVFHGEFTERVYLYAILMYNFGWCMTHPFLLGIVAAYGESGRYVTFAVAGQKLGLALGPSLAAMVLARGSYGDVFALAAVAFAITLVLAVPAARPILRSAVRGESL